MKILKFYLNKFLIATFFSRSTIKLVSNLVYTPYLSRIKKKTVCFAAMGSVCLFLANTRPVHLFRERIERARLQNGERGFSTRSIRVLIVDGSPEHATSGY